jgi:hypothetical protein
MAEFVVDEVVEDLYRCARAARDGKLNPDVGYETSARLLDLAAELEGTGASEILRDAGTKLARVAARAKAASYLRLARRTASSDRASSRQRALVKGAPPAPRATPRQVEPTQAERAAAFDRAQLEGALAGGGSYPSTEAWLEALNARERNETERLHEINRQLEEQRRREQAEREASRRIAEVSEGALPWWKRPQWLR